MRKRSGLERTRKLRAHYHFGFQFKHDAGGVQMLKYYGDEDLLKTGKIRIEEYTDRDWLENYLQMIICYCWLNKASKSIQMG